MIKNGRQTTRFYYQMKYLLIKNIHNFNQKNELDYSCGIVPTIAEHLVKKYGIKMTDGLEPNQGLLLEVACKKITMMNVY